MNSRYIKIFIVVWLMLFLHPTFLLASMGNYCSTPPFISAKVKSNVLFVMDFSGSMQFPAYYGYDFDGYYSSKVADCGDRGEVYATYDSNTDYYGYFESDKYYKYNSAGYWEVNSSCTNTDRIGNGNCISGNLLNWLVMSRIDVALKALIGGKADCDADYCYLRPQGSKRYIRDRTLHCEFFIRPKNYSSGDYAAKDVLINAKNYKGSCKIGRFQNRYAKVRVSKKERKGIVQNNFDVVRLGFMVFAGNNRYGEIRYGFHENDLDALISKFENEVPYYGTPTGEALWEAYDYLIQENDHSDENNSNYIHKASEKDPYYEKIKNGSVVKAPCRKTFVVLISDGEWNGGIDPVKPAYNLHAQDIRPDLEGNQTAKVFSLFTFSDSQSGENSMKTISCFGSFREINNCSNNWPYTFNNFPDNSKNVSFPRTNCNPSGTYKNCCKEWDEKDRNGIPDTYYSASDGAALQKALTEIFNEIIKEASSGTAASVLSEKEKVNMGVLQAAFYPEKTFVSGSSSYTVKWIGSLYNWWFYSAYSLDGYISNIREDTIYDGNSRCLDICTNGEPGGDYIIDYSFNNGKLKIKGYKSKCIGTKLDNSTPDVVYNGLDSANYVWEAGRKLSEERHSDRTIYTYVGDTLPTDSEKPLVELKSLNNSDTRKLSMLFGDPDKDESIIIDDSNGEVKTITFSKLKNYIYGEDFNGYRKRAINKNGDTWKLGDIVYSTPKVVNYRDYSVAFIGANDGMLHAFLVGKYRYDGLKTYQAGRLTNSVFDSDIGNLSKELWAFIPKNILPYLRFLADPDYCHIYFVDLTPYIIEIKDKWGNVEKRILIGGMRLGGAVGCDNSTSCINPPKDTCPDPGNYNSAHDPSTNPEGCLGLSSYFALDITDPTNPKFLWEFSHSNLGFSYSGPAFIKKKDDRDKWHYYIMFFSGPTDYKGDVGQHLYAFVLSLDSSLKRDDGSYNPAFFTVTNVYKKDLSGMLNSDYAFGGRLFTEGIDFNGDSVTDLVFEGVVENNNGKWEGNIIGVRPDGLNPAYWEYFKLFTSPIGPVIVPISYEKCFDKHFIYFGSGRYFYKEDTPDGEVERLYGIEIDSCENSNCSFDPTSLHASDVSCSYVGRYGYGWYQDLLGQKDGYNKERTITGATTTNEDVIFFTTTQPTSDICGFGGRSRLWGMNCATGESLTNQQCENYQTKEIVGTLLLQTSVGEISKFDINITNVTGPEGNITPFTQEGGKATEWRTGTAPPNESNYIPPPTRKPAKILYEIEN